MKECPLVVEGKVEEGNLPAQTEASMALVLLQTGDSVDEDDRMLELDEVVGELPDLDVVTLNPILVDGKEFLFLDDISKSLGFREDEARSILANTTSTLDEGETLAKPPTFAIDFEDHDLTKSLEYLSYHGQRTHEENVAAALVVIQDAAKDYDLPDSAFGPAGICVPTKVDNTGSININEPNIIDVDDNVEVRLLLALFLVC